MQVTIQTITDSAIDLADMRNSQFIDQSGTAGTELIRYANMAYKDIYQQIILSKEFYFTTTTTISILGGTSSYALPVDFYKLDGVDLALDTYYATAPFGQVYRYILVGANIEFVPLPTQAATIQLWYTPEPAVITSLAQIVSLPIGCDEYMSLYIASAMLSKEESDTTALTQKRLEIIDQLKNSLKDRDQGSAAYVIDESTVNAGALYPFRGND
jgi:hypothetical protein